MARSAVHKLLTCISLIEDRQSCTVVEVSAEVGFAACDRPFFLTEYVNFITFFLQVIEASVNSKYFRITWNPTYFPHLLTQ